MHVTNIRSRTRGFVIKCICLIKRVVIRDKTMHLTDECVHIGEICLTSMFYIILGQIKTAKFFSYGKVNN